MFLLRSIALCGILCTWFLGAAEPLAVYLTWQRDPATTMTVQWLTGDNEESDEVMYSADGEEWLTLEGRHEPFPYEEPYAIHRAELTGLTPRGRYRFRVGGDKRVYAFRTMPRTLKAPIAFVAGGDTAQAGIEAFRTTNVQAAQLAPDFALFGGDLAYAVRKNYGTKENTALWREWLAVYSETMVTPEGCSIPLIVTIGNHDVCGSYDQTPEAAPCFYALFATPGLPGYKALRFGYLTLYLLDSSHTNPIRGAQAEWLKEALMQDEGVLHKIACYHVPAFPSVRPYRASLSVSIRRHWVPLFERHGLHVALENHDHAYKRTYPWRDGGIDPDGVLYIGDGSWGAESRVPKEAWHTQYLAKSAEATQFLLVRLSQTEREFTSVSQDGEEVDHYVQGTVRD